MMCENDDLGYGESHERSGDERNPTRRSLLGAAGGFALAASGLLLPDRLVEAAEADSNPVRRIQGRKDQRRRKRGHHHRRQRRHKSGLKKPLLIRGIQFIVHAGGGSHPIEFYVHQDGFFNNGLRLVETKTFTPQHSRIYMETDDQFGALWIDGRYYIAAVNYIGPDMLEWAGAGGRIDLDQGWVDGQLGYKGELPETTRTIEGSAPAITDDHWYVHFLRRPDDANYKRFEILLQPRP